MQLSNSSLLQVLNFSGPLDTIRDLCTALQSRSLQDESQIAPKLRSVKIQLLELVPNSELEDVDLLLRWTLPDRNSLRGDTIDDIDMLERLEIHSSEVTSIEGPLGSLLHDRLDQSAHEGYTVTVSRRSQSAEV